MEDQSEKTLGTTIANSQRPTTSIIPPGQFTFTPVEEMFDNPMTQIADVIAVDPGYLSNIDQYKTDIDKYGINAMASLGSPIPSIATDTYNPVAQQNPSSNTFSQIQEVLDTNYSKGPANDRIAPRYASMKATQFMRYYKHPDFAELGFSPYSNNEEFYNTNSTIYDDMARMRGQFWSLAGSGFSSVYRSMGDALDGDSYFSSPDLETASEFENAMAIGNSSRSGGMAWTNNFLLNSAYTVGILGSIAVEELALAIGSAAATATGVGAPAGVGTFAAGTARNVYRAGNAFKNFFDVSRFASGARDIMNTLRATDAAKDFWSAASTGGKVLGQMFTPNTMYALKNLKTTKNATQNAINLAKMSATFGGFYRDARAVNLALAESKLEGGMVYNRIIAEGIHIAQNKSGRGVTPEEMQNISSKASKGAFYTTMANAPIIYASNWFVFGNALGGFNRSLGRVFNDSFTRGVKRIVKTKATRDSAGKLVKDVFEDVGTGIAGTIKMIKAGGAKGIVGRGAAGAARYFSANIAEGIQEVSQEAVSSATIGYFTEVLKDPLAGGIDLQNAMIASGMGEQLSGEGFSVFMSGFLMGGVIQGPQKLFFQGVPSIYKYGLNEAGISVGSKGQNEAWSEYKTMRDEFITQSVSAHNNAWNSHIISPESMFDSTKMNFLIQKQVADGMKTSAYNGDQFGFTDYQDFGKFQQMYHVFSNGSSHFYRQQLTDMLKLTDAELAEAYPADKKDIKSGKLRERLSNMVTQLDKMEIQYQASKDLFPNPFDRSVYNKGTREYVDEALKESAYEHARYLYMFTQDGFEQALERADGIFNTLANDPLFDKMAASDITVLLSMDSINRELDLLRAEIAMTIQDGMIPDKGIAESNKVKQEKIKRLQAIKTILEDPKNATSLEGGRKGSFDRRKIEKLRVEFRNYVRYMASSAGSFVNNDQIDEALKDIVDHIALKDRAKVYDKAIEYLQNPGRLDEIADRQLIVAKQYYKNIKTNFEETLKKYVDIVEANQLMNELASINVFVDPEQTKIFLQTNDASVLRSFYDDNGPINQINENGENIIINQTKYDLIQGKINVYVGINNKDTTEEKTEEQVEDQVIAENFSDVDAILNDAGITIVLEDTNNTPLLNQLLQKQYDLYSSPAALAGQDVMTFNEWRDSQQGINIQNSFNAIKRIWASGESTIGADGKLSYISPVSKADIKSEKGFIEWSKTRVAIEDPNINKILDISSLKYSDIFEIASPEFTEGDVINKNAKGETTKEIYYIGTLGNIVEITTLDPTSGEPTKFYKLVDKEGNDLSKEMRALTNSKYGSYLSAAEAKADLKIIEASAPSTGKFTFDGVEGLNQGMIIYDKKDGTKYIILSTPKQIQGGYLKIIEASKNHKNREDSDIKLLQVGQFDGSYTLQDISFTMLPKSVNRIQISELISFYPHVGREGRLAAVARLELIMSVLTPQELAGLELVIVEDTNSGESKGNYQIKGRDGTVYGEANPYIEELVSKYNIGVKIPASNIELTNKINAALVNAKLPISDSPNGVFGYLPNARYKLTNPQGESIVLPNITSEEAANTIFNSVELKALNKSERLKYIQNIFALNALLVSEIDSRIANEESIPNKLSDFSFDLSLIVEGAITAYPKAGNQLGRSFNDLIFNDSDGSGGIIIYDLKFDHEQQTRTVQTVTNLEGEELESKLRDKVQDGLEQQGLYNKMMNGSDRYYAIVLLPNGTYVPVNLKATQYTIEEREQLYLDLINRAQLTKEKNTKSKSDARDLAYNTEFNESLTDRLYISNIPGYLTSLQVDPWGKVELQLFQITSEKIIPVGKRITIDQDLVNDTELTSKQKIETLFRKFNDAHNSTGVNIAPKNLRQSFPDGTDVGTIIERSTTAVLPNVVEKQQLRITSDSSAIQAVINVSVIKPVVETPRHEDNWVPVKTEEFTVNFKSSNSQRFRAITYLDGSVEWKMWVSDTGMWIDASVIDAGIQKRDNISNEKAIKQYSESKDTREQGSEIWVSDSTGYTVGKVGGPDSIMNPKMKARLTEDQLSRVYPAETVSVVVETTIDKINSELDILELELLEGVPLKSHAKTLRGSKEFQNLIKKRKEIESQANKIVSNEDISEQDIENIDTFTNWASNNLPEFISIEDIDTLGDNLKAGGQRVGAFVLRLNQIAGGMNIAGTIYTGVSSPFKYHEAFHSVYRMLLTDQEIIKYRSIARKEVRAKLRSEGKSFEKELQKFRNSANTYSHMTQKELENEYYEEYLADEFEKFKTSPKNTNTDSEVKSLFTRILEWIKAVFSTNGKNKLQTLFENIDAGKYNDASLVSNEFTNSLAPGITLEANALIPYDSDSRVSDINGVKTTRVGYLYLDSDIADPLISGIAAMYVSRVSKIKGAYLPAEVLESVMDDYNMLYNPANIINVNFSEEKIERLNQIQTAFKIYPDEIKKSVTAQLNLIGSQLQDEEFTVDEFEDSLGLRTSTQFDKDASLIGGFNSLSFKLRAYIATTTLAAEDYFGNIELVEGEKLIVGVNFREAYNGLLKSVKNIEDPLLMLRSMYFFGQDNAQSGAVVRRILQDTGVSEIELLSGASLPVEIKNAELLQSLLKGFQNFRVDYIFNEVDNNGRIRIYSASQRDDINSQLERWNQAYISKRKQFSDPKVKKQIQSLLNSMNSSIKDTKKISNVKLQNQAKDYSERLFNLTGIKLSPLYLQFSIIQNKNDKTVKQNALISVNTEEVPLSLVVVEELRLAIQRNSTLFSNNSGGILSKLNQMSTNSAPFDETIGASVFKNSNGDLVYSHQLPTYHLKRVEELNNTSKLNELINSNPYLKNNYLLNSEAFKKLSVENRLRVIRIAGSKTVDKILSEESINDNISNDLSTQTYGEFTPQQFALSLINNYTALLNTKSDKVDRVEIVNEQGDTTYAAIAPILIRVMESSNTGDLISLAVLKAVEERNGKVVLTKKAIDEFYNKIDTEFNRINLEAFKTTDTSLVNSNELIVGYNDNIEGRAFKFSNTDMMFSSDLQSTLANIAIEEGKKISIVSLEDAIKTAGLTVEQFKNNIVEKVEIQYDKFNETLDEINASNILSNNITKGLMISKGVASNELVKSARLLNLNNNKDHNLKQIFFNNWINTAAINEILLGDEAISLKNSIDKIKRAKMQNASYYSAYSAIAAPKLGVNHNVEDISLVTLEEPIGASSITGENIESADAQMFITIKAFRYMWFGFGKLSPSQANLIDDIEAGKTISSESIFGDGNIIGYASQQAMLNSKKLVYGDGSTFLKMSAFTLTKEYTSRFNENTKLWEAKPTRVKLHNLRVKLEAIERTKNTISIAVPLSGVKMLKRRVVSLDSLNNDTTPLEHSTLNARYMGLQVINPSNKLEIPDPTQIKEIATSEQKDNVKVPALGLNEKGNVMTVGDVRRLYNKAVSQRLMLTFKGKRNLVFTLDTALEEFKVSKKAGAVTPNLVAFLRYATEGLKASQSSSSLIDFFSTTDGVQNYNLNNPITIRKFEQLFLSYFSRGVLSERVPGIGLTLVSDYGNLIYRRVYEIENGIPVRSEVIREKIANKMNVDLVYTLDQLTNEIIPAEGVIVLDRLRSGLMGYTDITDSKTATGERYIEGIIPAHYKSVMDLVEDTDKVIPEVISKMFSVRIPTQDNHSALSTKMVDFLPAYYGSIAMFAREIVEISGADFDNDKVYTLIKEFFVDNGNFEEYGKGSDAYFEYITYINEKVNKAGTIYSEALGLYKNNDLQSRIENSATENDLNIAGDAGLSENSIAALQILGLPITNVQFKTYKDNHGDPYPAPLNNKILDYKYALIANKGVTESKSGIPISYSPASTTVLIDALKELAEVSDYFKNKLNEEVVDVNNLDGKIKAFIANKGTSIGSVVLPNLYLSLLTEYKIKLKPGASLRINGNVYNNYGVTEINGQRKQDTISAIITMETDNSKDRLVSKLGLNKHAAGLLVNLTALGVPLVTGLLLINNPIIKKLYSTALNKTDKFDIGINGLVSIELNKLKKGSKLIKVTDAILLESINTDGRGSSKNKIFSILSLFQQATKIKDYTNKMGAITGLSKGLGRNMAEVNKKAETILDLFKGDAPMDLAPIYKGNTFQNTYLRIFYQIKDSLLPATFLTASSEFQEIINPVFYSMATDSMDFTQEVIQDVRIDLLSFLTIKGFEKYGLDNSPGKVAALNNNIIYPNEGPSIISIVDRLRGHVDSEGITNVFLNDFINELSSTDSSNNSGLNLINANTFRNITAGQKIDLQNDFAKLYGNLETKDDALSILNYIMVKDGLQLKYNSLLEAINPFVMSDYLEQINSVEKVLKGESTYESVFGVSKEQLTEEFKLGYLSSNVNNAKIRKFNVSSIKNSDNIVFSREKGTLTFKDPSLTSKDLTNEKLLKFPKGVFLRVSYPIGLDEQMSETYFSPGRGLGLESEGVYTRIDSMGSNQQWGGGFMFGNRLTYKQVRTFVNNKNGEEGSGMTEEMLLESVQVNKPIQQNSKTINIYAGTNENASLSNFANRPFTDDNNWGEEFNTVEGAFQAAKFNFTDAYNREKLPSGSYLINDEGVKIKEKLKTATGAEAKKIGRGIKGLKTKEWDLKSEEIMHDNVYFSFEQNPDALQKLLATGNATLTHTQDKGKWGKLFPKILMEVRSELGGAQSIQQSSEVKEGVSGVFNENPEVANVGTEQQYSEYLDSVFSNSQVKDIVYHGSNEKFDKFKDITYFTDTLSKASGYAKNRADSSFNQKLNTFYNKYIKIHNSSLNGNFVVFSTNPLLKIKDATFKTFKDAASYRDKVVQEVPSVKDEYDSIKKEEFILYKAIINVTKPLYKTGIFYESKTEGHDSIIGNDQGKGATLGKTFVIFESEQIHILGSQEDIQGFKEFVGRPTQQSRLETITFAEESSNKQIQEDVLKSDSTTIIANEKEVKVKVNKGNKAVNISDTKALLSDLLSRQDEIADEINRAEVVSEVDETLPVLDPKEQIQYDLFESEITSEVTKYAYLAEQYDELIKDGSNRSIMMDNNLFPLSSMIEEYQNTMKYESKGEEVNQKEFIDNIKKCILK